MKMPFYQVTATKTSVLNNTDIIDIIYVRMNVLLLYVFLAKRTPLT